MGDSGQKLERTPRWLNYVVGHVFSVVFTAPPVVCHVVAVKLVKNTKFNDVICVLSTFGIRDKRKCLQKANSTWLFVILKFIYVDTASMYVDTPRTATTTRTTTRTTTAATTKTRQGHCCFAKIENDKILLKYNEVSTSTTHFLASVFA